MKIEESIIKVLVYFDLFHYPLTKEEIRSFLDQPVEEKMLNDVIDTLVSTQRIFQIDNFISLQDDLSLAVRRKTGNAKATELLMQAGKIARLIFKFPYVRAVGVSGSVSKNFADEQADIDYFIITSANRLWIARTFLHLFKKIPFLRNRHTHFCMNYFIDEAELVIEEKNIYTATELYTLIPIWGNDCIQKFFKANSWSFQYFPNRDLPFNKDERSTNNSWIKKTIEFFLNNKLGDWLDNYFLKLTTRRWKLKEVEERLNTKGERMGLKTSKHCSKPNPAFFHDWFMERYEKKLIGMQIEELV